jgi:hypothetical protein
VWESSFPDSTNIGYTITNWCACILRRGPVTVSDAFVNTGSTHMSKGRAG